MLGEAPGEDVEAVGKEPVHAPPQQVLGALGVVDGPGEQAQAPAMQPGDEFRRDGLVRAVQRHRLDPRQSGEVVLLRRLDQPAAGQLRRRFPQSPEVGQLERGAFND